MIRHTVAFKLEHLPGSNPESEFLQALQRLGAIPGVQNFECLRQTGTKNHFTFGASMEFASPQDYQAYNEHPDHVLFVQTRWQNEVTDFMEIDYEPLVSR